MPSERAHISGALTFLAGIGLGVGAFANKAPPHRRSNGELIRRELPGPGETSWLLGSALICSWCTKVVGCWTIRPVFEAHIIDPMAGWVLERTEQILDGAFVCGEHGCDRGPHHENPLACSDRCEMAILNSSRWEACEPPPGYQRWSAGL